MDHGILIAGWTDPATLLSFAKGAFGLGVVIFVHELGHFLVAKACGVKCEKFYVGFDPPLSIGPIKLPRTLFKKQWGETEYGIGIIPLGGYVKMLGQDDNPANAAKEAERIKLAKESGDLEAVASLDPRSYPAKSVPQRMAIISAGVVFNLIFGALFAAMAYKMGVTYTPCVIGGTSVGDPAWRANLQPGDKIIKLGHDEKETEHLRFRQDLKVKMFSLDDGEKIDLTLITREGNRREVTLTPDSGFKKQVGTPTIGIVMGQDPQVFKVFEDSVAKNAGLLPGDKIQAVSLLDGTKRTIGAGAGTDVQAFLARYPSEPIVLEILRENKETGSEETKNIELPASPGKRFGLEFSMGPIVALQSDSVADQAGLKIGDIITDVAGQPVGDPITLPRRMMQFIDQPISLRILRDNSERTISLTPVAPNMLTSVRRPNGPVGLETLGIGYRLHPTVRSVILGSPAEKAGIEAGDVVQSFVLVPHEPTRAIRKGLAEQDLDKPVPLDEEHSNWPWLLNTFVLESQHPFEIDLNIKRGSKEQIFHLKPEISDTIFDPERGFALKLKEDVNRAPTMGTALALGVRETWEGMEQVVMVLRKIKDNYQNLGGPLTIAAAATMEASEGLPRLLIFLTLLSANLAVLNFLPIPVLDGGHMMFLAYEGIVGKPVNERLIFGLSLAGLCLLITLMVCVLYLDINRFLG